MTDNRKLPQLHNGSRWDDFGGVVNGDQSITICRVDYLQCGDDHVIGVLPKKGKGLGIWLSDIRAFLKVNHPDPELAAAQRRVSDLERAAQNLLTKIKDSTQDGVLTESDDHFFSVDDYIEIESIAPETTALESLLAKKEADGD